jgi:cytochrome c oxidase subunit II
MFFTPKGLPFFPEAASSIAPHVDALCAFLVLVSAFFSLLIAFLVVFFAVKYRKRSGPQLPPDTNIAGHGAGLILEIVWTIIPLGLSMIMFVWGASIFFTESRPPADSMEVYVTGKQWMWKIQHMEGPREINELHIPVDRDIRLTMTSEDVIHDFFVPAFRTKADVLPGKYTTEWFRPTKVGQYHIFCAEYCGTKHSGMIGSVYVMEPQDYQNWLSGGAAQGSMAQRGERLFQDLACSNCHKTDATGRCPNLVGLFGKKVQLADGRTVNADEAYIRESILQPTAKIAAGYQPIMPTFQGLVTEEGVLQLIEYIKSIGPKPATGAAPETPSMAGSTPRDR